MEINFNLRDPGAKEPTPINIVIRYSGYRIVFPSRKKVHPRHWNNKKQRVKELAEYPDSVKINADLQLKADAIKDAFDKYFHGHNKTVPPPNVLRTILEEDPILKYKTGERKIATDTVNLLVWDPSENHNYGGYLTKFIEELGARHNERTGQPIAKNTIRNYKSFRECLREFAEAKKSKRKRIEFNDVSLDFYFDFVNYLTSERKLTPNAIGTHVKNLKAVIRDAEERGIIVNASYKSRRFVTVQTITHAVYLTKTEVDELANLDLREDARLKRARDLFLIGCRTGLRFSDFVKLRNEDFETGKLRIRTQKTKDHLFIPIHHDVHRIRSEYTTENHLPQPISNQKFNEAIRDVCQLVPSLNKQVSVTEIKGGTEVTVKVPKWKLIASHTARRTFATNCYLDGIPTRTIRQITGHKKEEDFFRYIRMTEEDDAKILEMHFNSEASTLKVV